MPISFNEIPDVKEPGIFAEIDNSNALSGLPGKESVMLVIGRMSSGSTATAEKPVEISVKGEEADTLFGAGSECARMIAKVRKNNTFNRLFCIPLSNDSGTAAVKTITLTASSPKAGAVYLYIAGRRFAVDVTTSSTAASLATAIAAAINAKTETPVTASASEGVVTCTAKCKGLSGNDIDYRLNYNAGEETASGVTVTFADSTAGASNPDLTSAIAVMADTYYTGIVCPYTDTANLALMRAELERRFGAMVRIESVLYSGLKGTMSAMQTASAATNCPHFFYIETYKSPDAPEERAAALMGVAEYNAQIDPARQLKTLELKGCLPPETGDGLIYEERNLLIKSGISTTTESGGKVLISRVVSDYTKNAFGSPDASYMDWTTIKTLTYLRFSYVARFAQKFPRHKLADDTYVVKEGQAIVTPTVAKAEAIALAQDWLDAGLIENLDDFKASIVSERNANDTERLDQLLKPDIINNLRVVAGKIQFKL
ncbi:MAG: phage tail sheath subtilisin-like domain-containing protein [Alphaproteobacteria bacterium]|nr:phage tail sheath subtilisin-like domain-containing protein [Alphaproteobacteria bacterium]